MNPFNLIRSRRPRNPQPRPQSARPASAFEAMEPRVLLSADGLTDPVRVAGGDVNGDGRDDIAGVYVATGDINNDGVADAIVYDQPNGIIAILIGLREVAGQEGGGIWNADITDGTSNTIFATDDGSSDNLDKLTALLLPYIEQDNLYKPAEFKLVEVKPAEFKPAEFKPAEFNEGETATSDKITLWDYCFEKI